MITDGESEHTLRSIPSMKLSEFLASFPPQHLVATTYSLSLVFFESVVFPFVKKEKLESCLILCDRGGLSRATAEAPALKEAGRSYSVVPAPWKGSFHSKVWLILSDECLGLLVGSGNLTQSGFINNSELFEVHLLEKGGEYRQLGLDLIDFVDGLATMWPDSVGELLARNKLNSFRSQLKQFVSTLTGQEQSPIRFLSTFQGSFLERFPSEVKGGRLYVASPFFGGSLAGLKSLVEFLEPEAVFLYPAIFPDGSVDFDWRRLNALGNVIPEELALSDSKSGFAHLKLYGFEAPDEKCWLFIGSPNCTEAALLGNNLEAGILRQVPKEILRAYFKGSELQERDKRSQNFDMLHSGSWIEFSATLLPQGIQLSQTSPKNSPLVKAHITLQNASRNYRCGPKELFTFDQSETILWREFTDDELSWIGSFLVQISADSPSGHQLAGAAFVDHIEELNATPEHRRARTAIQELFREEALPELSGIVALYSSMLEILNTDPGPRENGSGTTTNPKDKAERSVLDKIPVWPPIVSTSSPQYAHPLRYDSRLYWLQGMLRLLFKGNKSENGDRESNEEHTKGEFKIPERSRHRARSLGKISFEKFFFFVAKLNSLVLTEREAKWIWPVSAAMLLSTLAVRLKVLETATEEVVSANDLVASLFSALFLPRRNNDFPPGDCRYRSNIYPSLAVDLKTNFDILPCQDFVNIFGVGFVYLAGSDYELFRKKWLNSWLCFRDLSDWQLSNPQEACSQVEPFLGRFFLKSERPRARRLMLLLEELAELDWKQHPGYQDLQRLVDHATSGSALPSCQLSSHLVKNIGIFQMRLKSRNRMFRSVDSLSTYCPESGCSKAHQITPEKRALPELRPVICSGCGIVLVPDTLVKVYRNRGGDELP